MDHRKQERVEERRQELREQARDEELSRIDASFRSLAAQQQEPVDEIYEQLASIGDALSKAQGELEMALGAGDQIESRRLETLITDLEKSKAAAEFELVEVTYQRDVHLAGRTVEEAELFAQRKDEEFQNVMNAGVPKSSNVYRQAEYSKNDAVDNLQCCSEREAPREQRIRAVAEEVAEERLALENGLTVSSHPLDDVTTDFFDDVTTDDVVTVSSHPLGDVTTDFFDDVTADDVVEPTVITFIFEVFQDII